MHNHKLDTIMDVTITYERGPSGEYFATPTTTMLPADYNYFTSRRGMICLIFEVLFVGITTFLTLNELLIFAKRARRAHAENTKRQNRFAVVRSSFLLYNSWDVVSDLDNLAIPMLIGSSIVLKWYYYLNYSKTFGYKDVYQVRFVFLSLWREFCFVLLCFVCLCPGTTIFTAVTQALTSHTHTHTCTL